MMEVRFFRKTEKQELLNSIDRLWKHNHIYVRNPDVLDHLVLNTPYRAAFAGEDNYSFLGIWDEEQVVGLRGIIPQKLNFFGQEYDSATSTIWATDTEWKRRVDGLSLRRYVTDYHLGMDLSLGLSEMSLPLYRPFGYDLIENFPRWILITNVTVAKEVLLPKGTDMTILPQMHRSNIHTPFSIEVDELDREKWDAYYSKKFAPRTIGTKRDYEFLHWRYEESPVLKYHCITVTSSSGDYRGLAVIRIEPILDGQYVIGRILEFMTLDSEASIVLANTILDFSPEVLMWDFYSLADTTSYGLEMAGFIKIPDGFDKILMPTRFHPID